jgi:hypothetical protein
VTVVTANSHLSYLENGKNGNLVSATKARRRFAAAVAALTAPRGEEPAQTVRPG